MIYIIAFSCSLLLLLLAEIKRFRGYVAHISVAIALAIPCLLAGLRDVSIGTDVRVYVEPLFEAAKASDSILEYYSSAEFAYSWAVTRISDMEFGFTLLGFISAKVFNSLPAFLLMIQALTIIPIYKGLRSFSKQQPVWLGMAVYYLMYFNQSLNMMRQWIAMAFLFYGFQFLTDGRYRRYFLNLAIAFLFHNSAVLGIVIFWVYQLVANENAYNKKVKVLLLLLIGVGSLISLDLFVGVLSLLGLRYGNYISGSLTLMPNQLLYRLPILLLLLWRWKYLKRADRFANFYLVMVAYDLLASQLTSIFGQSGRIGIFFSEYYMLAYPAICVASSSKKNRQTMRLFTLSYLCVYWWYMYVYMGAQETVPYVSIF